MIQIPSKLKMVTRELINLTKEDQVEEAWICSCHGKRTPVVPRKEYERVKSIEKAAAQLVIETLREYEDSSSNSPAKKALRELQAIGYDVE